MASIGTPSLCARACSTVGDGVFRPASMFERKGGLIPAARARSPERTPASSRMLRSAAGLIDLE